jgi:hypothetical protein
LKYAEQQQTHSENVALKIYEALPVLMSGKFIGQLNSNHHLLEEHSVQCPFGSGRDDKRKIVPMLNEVPYHEQVSSA